MAFRMLMVYISTAHELITVLVRRGLPQDVPTSLSLANGPILAQAVMCMTESQALTQLGLHAIGNMNSCASVLAVQ